VIAQLAATRVAPHPPGFDPSVDPKFTEMIHGYFPAVDSAPPTMRVVPSRPQVHVDAVVVVVVVIVVVVVVEVVVVVDVVVVVVVVVLVSSGQQGPVGCVGVMSKPNLARLLLLQSLHVPCLGIGAT